MTASNGCESPRRCAGHRSRLAAHVLEYAASRQDPGSRPADADRPPARVRSGPHRSRPLRREPRSGSARPCRPGPDTPRTSGSVVTRGSDYSGSRSRTFRTESAKRGLNRPSAYVSRQNRATASDGCLDRSYPTDSNCRRRASRAAPARSADGCPPPGPFPLDPRRPFSRADGRSGWHHGERTARGRGYPEGHLRLLRSSCRPITTSSACRGRPSSSAPNSLHLSFHCGGAVGRRRPRHADVHVSGPDQIHRCRLGEESRRTPAAWQAGPAASPPPRAGHLQPGPDLPRSGRRRPRRSGGAGGARRQLGQGRADHSDGADPGRGGVGRPRGQARPTRRRLRPGGRRTRRWRADYGC